MIRRILLVIILVLLTVWLASCVGVRAYRLGTQFSYKVESATSQLSSWYPPLPFQWNRVGLLVGSAQSHDPLAEAVVEQLARALTEVFPEVVNLGRSSTITAHNDRLDAVLVFTAWQPQVKGPIWNKKFSFDLELKSFEPVTHSLKQEHYRFFWHGRISGSVRGLLPRRLLMYRLAEQVSDAIYRELSKYMRSRKGENAAAAVASVDNPVKPIQWFEPIHAQAVLDNNHPLVPDNFTLVSHFIQRDLYGTTEFLALRTDLNSADARVRLREHWRNHLGSTATDFASTAKGKWVMELTRSDVYYLVSSYDEGAMHIVVKEPGRLSKLHLSRDQVLSGEKNLDSLITEAQEVFMNSPMNDTRLFLANCQLEEFLIKWKHLESSRLLQELDNIERMFLSCHHPHDDAFDAYLMGRFYYKLGVNCDSSYLLSAEHALNHALESGSSEVYPYALLAKALVLSAPEYDGHDFKEARRILKELSQVPVLRNEAQLQLQRVLLLSPEDSDPESNYDNILASYVAMLQGDWDRIEKLLLKDPVQLPVERACRALMYLNLCKQTGRESAEIKALAELQPQYLLLLEHFMRERYCGIYR